MAGFSNETRTLCPREQAQWTRRPFAPMEVEMRVIPHRNRFMSAAKRFSGLSGRKLSDAQDLLAQAIGYRGLFDLDRALHQELEKEHALSNDEMEQFFRVLTQLLISNCDQLDTASALSEIADWKLVSDRHFRIEHLIELRRKLFLENELPPAPVRQTGAIGVARRLTGKREAAILRQFGQPTLVTKNGSLFSDVADFEYKSPRKQRFDLFIPLRLFIPYGNWLEKDGSFVLFSRDYFPLWRLSNGKRPQRMYPWERINYESQEHFWGPSTAPWESEEFFQREISRLNEFGIRSIPRTVEALPLIIKDSKIDSARSLLDRLRPD